MLVGSADILIVMFLCVSQAGNRAGSQPCSRLLSMRRLRFGLAGPRHRGFKTGATHVDQAQDMAFDGVMTLMHADGLLANSRMRATDASWTRFSRGTEAVEPIGSMKHDDSTEVLFQGVEIEDRLAVLRLASCNILSRLENYEVPCFAFHAQGFGLDDFGLLKLLATSKKNDSAANGLGLDAVYNVTDVPWVVVMHKSWLGASQILTWAQLEWKKCAVLRTAVLRFVCTCERVELTLCIF